MRATTFYPFRWLRIGDLSLCTLCVSVKPLGGRPLLTGEGAGPSGGDSGRPHQDLVVSFLDPFRSVEPEVRLEERSLRDHAGLEEAPECHQELSRQSHDPDLA